MKSKRIGIPFSMLFWNEIVLLKINYHYNRKWMLVEFRVYKRNNWLKIKAYIDLTDKRKWRKMGLQQECFFSYKIKKQ